MYYELGVISMYRRIRDLREDKELTQVQVAKILNCSQRAYRITSVEESNKIQAKSEEKSRNGGKVYDISGIIK